MYEYKQRANPPVSTLEQYKCLALVINKSHQKVKMNTVFSIDFFFN